MASQYMVWLNSLHSFGAVVKYWMHLSCQDSNSNNACLGLLNWKLIIDCRTKHCLIQGLMHSSFAQSKSSSDFRCPWPMPCQVPPGKKSPLPFVASLLPPTLLALSYPDVFFKALDYAGTYGVLLLFGLVPAAMAWSERLTFPFKVWWQNFAGSCEHHKELLKLVLTHCHIVCSHRHTLLEGTYGLRSEVFNLRQLLEKISLSIDTCA